MHPILERATARLILNSPFISCILLSTEVIETDKIPFTAATDGDKIFVNMKEFLKIPEVNENNACEYLTGILAHEVDHIALLHPLRRGNRDVIVMDASGQQVSLWNIACDAPVNEMLAVDGFKLLSGCVRMPGAENKSAEEIYDELLKKVKNNPKVSWVSFDNVMDGATPKEGDGGKESISQGERETKVKLKVQKALDVAKACGKLPASLARLVESALESKVDWREQLRDAVTTIMKKDDYTWSRMNRRYVWNNQYMPGFEGNQTGPVFLAFDTSGSIGGEELSSFLGEMNAIFEDCKPESISVGFCDCSFYSPHTELTEDDMPMEPKQFSKITKGGGGTAFSPVFDYVNKNNIKPDMLIYFTDLCGNDFGNEPNYPVIWVTTHSTEAPWGKVIKLEK